MPGKIKVAVAGAGYWGKNLVRNFNSLGVLGVICDNQKETLIAFSEKYPQVQGTDSFQSVLEDGSMTAVAIATPAETHYLMVKEALLADKHVFVEKPLALLESEGTQLHELAKEKNKGLFNKDMFVGLKSFPNHTVMRFCRCGNGHGLHRSVFQDRLKRIRKKYFRITP